MRIDAADDDALHSVLGREQDLLEHKRGCRHDTRNGCNLLDDRIVIAHAVLHPILYDDMSRRAKNLGLNVLFKPGHDADCPDQGRHTERDPGNGDHGIQRDRPIPAFRAQISQSDKDFVGKGHRYFSGLS